MGCSNSSEQKPQKAGKKNQTSKRKAPERATPESKMEAMRAFVLVAVKKAEEILNSSINDEVTKYIMDPTELLTDIRIKTKSSATPFLTAAFNVYDDEEKNKKLSKSESSSFIADYFQCNEALIKKIYETGMTKLGITGDEAEKKLDAVLKEYRSKEGELVALWHQACDCNGDGELQLEEVKVAFYGEKAGEAEKKLGAFLTAATEDLMFAE
eukprot:TRINITY_DN2384_c0_g1_i1.p1 TRINITY_DN2384_c0_g1~~TRINITY_DN2384_c0_g1_i1.p1  ORF type:complete len:212 (+),score=61.46 TRINITY_DN2384_c0_g1_i1:46-681(+)